MQTYVLHVAQMLLKCFCKCSKTAFEQNFNLSLKSVMWNARKIMKKEKITLFTLHVFSELADGTSSTADGSKKSKEVSGRSKSNGVNHFNDQPTNGATESVEEPHRKKVWLNI